MDKNKKGLSQTGLVILAVALLLSLALIAAATLLKPSPDILDGDGFYKSACLLAEPVYPEMHPYPCEMGRDFEESFNAWNESVRAQQRDLEFTPELENFFRLSIRSFLPVDREKNFIISPLNIYMSMSMLAEVSGGDSRQEILNALNCPDMENLRSRASALWNANYRRDGATSLVLANSLWLRDGMEYKSDTINILTDNYYASSYTGIMGSEEYNKLLKDWISRQSEGLLKDAAGNESFDPRTVMALASSICYKAKWQNEFSEEKTASGTFHSPSGDMDADFMHSSRSSYYYWGEDFGAVKIPLSNGGGSIMLLLPDEGTTPHELFSGTEALDFVFSVNSWENSKYLIINLSLPKFDAESSAELKSGMEKMGICRVFSKDADFSPLCEDAGLFLSQATHSARITADEEGISAAAYTLMAAAGAGMPPEEEIDFTLDRPFIFVINSDYGQPLFAGIINKP